MKQLNWRHAPIWVAVLSAGLVLAGDTDTPNGPVFQGTEVAIDLPNGEVASGGQRVRNFGAPRDGQGLCVFASMDMIARFQNIAPLIGIINKIPNGGGWPEKVDAVVQEHAPGWEIVQYQGSDPAILDKAIKTGRPCGVTYGYGSLYGNHTIAHMVMLVHLDAKLAAIIDNNDPLKYTWMDRDEFLRRWVHPHNQGWAYVFLSPPPPPVPHNGR